MEHLITYRQLQARLLALLVIPSAHVNGNEVAHFSGNECGVSTGISNLFCAFSLTKKITATSVTK